MGRGPLVEPPVPAEWLAANFTVDVTIGTLIRKACTASGTRFVGKPSVYDNGEGLRVRVTYRGKKRTIAAPKVAWIVHTGSYPRGVARTVGVPDDFRLGNLTVLSACSHKPQSGAGKASSLVRRQEADRALLAALAAHEGASIAQLARITSTGESRVSTHLGKLAVQGLTVSPMCIPGRAWLLTDQGRAAAMGGAKTPNSLRS